MKNLVFHKLTQMKDHIDYTVLPTHNELIQWPSGLGWWTGIHNEALNQEVMGSIPVASSSRKVFIRVGNSNGFSLLNLSTFYGHSVNLAPPATS